MDKTAIKNFSIWARNKLIADITYKAGLLGVTEEGIKDALPQSTQDAEFYDIGTKEPYAIHGEEIKQRKELVAAIKRKATQLDYKDAYRNVVEEVAYTWFNRLIAIRFMEVNDYMPAHIRVLSSDSKNKLEPDLVTTPFDAELEFTQAETEKIMQMKNDNQVDALFRFLFIKQCNALNAYLPKLFEKTSDYTELLLNVSVTDQDGIVYHLTHDIAEADFNISDLGEDGKPTGQVEIIGWMYQYYNTEPKDEAFALLKSNVKITKERIPAATQLFTPDWIVRYMVENSVGRLWLEGHEDNNLKDGWKYYLDEAEQDADVEEQLRAIREEYKNIKPEEIKVIDPCMGSGHILVYAFDVLMQIYESYGYSQRDAAKSIVENNIYGLDIDDRAFQLAYFAIMMKARSYNRRFLTLEIEPNLCAIQESNGLQYEQDMGDFLLSEEHRETLKYLLHTFVDAKEYGSILNVEKRDYDGFLEAWKLTAEATLGNVVMMLWYNECNKVVPILAKQARILAMKYDVMLTNPPYMGLANGSGKLNTFVKKHYPNSKTDLFAVFIERCRAFCKKQGFQAMITQHAWMFLSSYEKLREVLFRSNTIINMAHLGARAFEEIGGEVVQTTSFVFRIGYVKGYLGTYARLVSANSQKAKENMYLEKSERYSAVQEDFEKIPGSPAAYWAKGVIDAFVKGKGLNDIAIARSGLSTGNNDKYMRLWHEVDFEDICFTAKNNEDYLMSGRRYVPCNKGGGYRKWYGNNDYIIDWTKPEEFHRPRTTYMELYYRQALTWSVITTGIFNSRYYGEGFLFDHAAASLFCNSQSDVEVVLAFLNSNTCNYILDMINPTMNTGAEVVMKMPLIIPENISELKQKCLENIQIMKEEWDSHETSWDFQKHPLVKDYTTSCILEQVVTEYEDRYNEQREILRHNEMIINQSFIETYGLEKELTGMVADADLSMPPFNVDRLVKELISYIVGCMFGRYSLDTTGIVYGGGLWDIQKYHVLAPDNDNIVMIVDEEYLEDDIVARFVKYISYIFGEETLEQNLDYIAKILGKKGTTSREVIRAYFISDFYKFHCTEYSSAGSGKRPIYLLFDSGKQNGFKALIYMHRYNEDTIGNVRVDYLHKIERIYESELDRMKDVVENGDSAREIAIATKKMERLQKQIKECQSYDEKLAHLALSRTKISLRDGFKVNYDKIQTASDGKKYSVLSNI